MNKVFRAWNAVWLGLFSICLSLSTLSAAETTTNNAAAQIRIVEVQGKVEVSSAGANVWTAGKLNQLLNPSDRLRTGPNSRVSLRWSDQSVVPFGALTELEILPPRSGESEPSLQLHRGVLSFFHRAKPGRIRVLTRGATAGIEGTEFVMAVNDSDRTTVSVVDGRVSFGNQLATLTLTNGQQAVADVGQAPVQTAGFVVNNVLQWCFYYPAVLDPAELNLSSDEQTALAPSLAAYRSGDLLNALAQYPQGRQPVSDAERVYYAALLLSVGQVEQTEAALASLPTGDNRPQQLALALRQLIAAVKRQTVSSTTNLSTATELLAASYYEQSLGGREHSLETARTLAREATVKSPQFGFAWTRLAELEFSFGRTKAATEALDKGLILSPRNAQALALKGFLLAADNQTVEAITWFDRALEVDSALGNAWLGRGLCRIRRGDVAGGREDLLIAAALEPQRSDLRSYLGKAHETAGDYPHADRELELAKKLDPNDPTPYLYSALVNQQNNRVNDAIRDLEKSQELNDNRSVYRSQLMLNQDHAVRSANLAQIYADAGMTDVGYREASRAVTYDYANYSAHLFLAYSYEAMRDRNNYDLRYETPAFSEYYLANLLAPVEAGPLSPAVSQGEYSRLFSQHHFGLVSSTEYLSRGAWSQSFAQYGTFDTFNYSLEGTYISDPGQYANNDYELKQLSLSIKQRLTAQDHVYLNVGVARWEAGDVRSYYDPNSASREYRTEEEQIPDVALGYHHEWSPGVHTLLLLGRLAGENSASNPNDFKRIVALTGENMDEIPAILSFPASWEATMESEVFSAELQQIFQQENHSTVLGTLIQSSSRRIENFEQTEDGSYFPVPNEGPGTEQPFTLVDQDLDVTGERFRAYVYESWQIWNPLLLVGGLSYDWLNYPRNWNSPPMSDDQRTKDQISPKAGLVWTPTKDTTLRAAYTRSLTGISREQSFRIEPTQVAGLNQAYRSLISESIVGATSGAELDTYGLSLEQKFDTGTYLGLGAELLYSEVHRHVGTYSFPETDDYASFQDFPLREHLNQRERSLTATVDQLLGEYFSIGARYRLVQSQLDRNLVDIPETEFPEQEGIPRKEHLESLLHHLNLHLNFNHASGLFASFEAVWYRQENTEDFSNQTSVSHTGDDFWQFNLLGGYRFWQRRARVEAGVLNLTDQDYRLHPVVWHNDLPRERTFVARLQLSF